MSETILITEQSNPRTAHIDRMSTMEMLRIMNDENKRVAVAVEEALEQIAPLVDHIAGEMKRGGRMFYVGAGTSGRLGAVDAAECPPTFGVSPDCVTAVVAGGSSVMLQANEGIEDDRQAGGRDIMQYHINDHDTVIGISAAGGAQYVLGAMEEAARAGAKTASICANPDTPMSRMADFAVFVNTGPEAVTGSTRLKAGSAQKMVLNLISTSVMIKLGNVYGNYMINLNPKNEKLHRRAVRTVCILTDCEEDTAQKALEAYGSVRGAVDAITGQE